MNYTKIVSALREKLDFMNDQAVAEGATRRVLAILASRLDTAHTRALARELPGVDLSALQSMEQHTRDDYTDVLRREFFLSLDQARLVVITVLQQVAEELPREARGGICEAFPPEMENEIRLS